MHITTYIGVVFSFVGPLSLDYYHLDLLMSFNQMLTFPSLSTLVLLFSMRISPCFSPRILSWPPTLASSTAESASRQTWTVSQCSFPPQFPFCCQWLPSVLVASISAVLCECRADRGLPGARQFSFHSSFSLQATGSLIKTSNMMLRLSSDCETSSSSTHQHHVFEKVEPWVYLSTCQSTRPVKVPDLSTCQVANTGYSVSLNFEKS